MFNLFRKLLERGTPFGLILSEKQIMTSSVEKISMQKLREREKKVVMLGTGDLAFPIVLDVATLYELGLAAAVGVIIGSFVGLVFVHYLLFVRNMRMVPALPPIAYFSIMGLAIAACI